MQKHQVKLIENQFDKEEARDLVLILINDKIRFLQRKIFMLQERVGCDTQKIEQRLSELKLEKSRVMAEFDLINNVDCSVEIDCHIHLKIHEHQRVVV